MSANPVPENDGMDANPPLSRAEWMTLLAESPVAEIESHWRTLPHPAFEWLRRPEYGSAMVRGRASGTGAQFNLGEVSVTRCTLQIGTGEIGIAYVMGRDKRHAALAALFDAMLQHESAPGATTTGAAPGAAPGAATETGKVGLCLASLAEARTRRHRDIVSQTRSSKVDFTMLSRSGENQ